MLITQLHILISLVYLAVHDAYIFDMSWYYATNADFTLVQASPFNLLIWLLIYYILQLGSSATQKVKINA